MEHVSKPDGTKGIRLEAPADGVDSEVWLGSLTLGALARDTQHPSAMRARELKKALAESFMDDTPYELFGDDVELLREALVKDIAEERPTDDSEFLQLAAETYIAKANEMIAALPTTSE